MSKFAVVIHAEPQGGYWGEVPALPGCYSQGETVDQLLANLREVIAGVLEVIKEEGWDCRSPKNYARLTSRRIPSAIQMAFADCFR